MTRREVIRLFMVFKTAWPSANVFSGGSVEEIAGKLERTVALWALCLDDVDFSTAMKATIRLVKVKKFMPTVAELREAVAQIQAWEP